MQLMSYLSLFETNSERPVETESPDGDFTQTAENTHVTDGSVGGLTQPLRIYS
jgi:hypothetical protein